MVKQNAPKPGQLCRVFPNRQSRQPYTVMLIAPSDGGWLCTGPTGEGIIYLSGPRPYKTQLQ